jgi:hypothetical protein
VSACVDYDAEHGGSWQQQLRGCVLQVFWNVCVSTWVGMDTAAEMAKSHLNGDTTWMLFDMLQNRWESKVQQQCLLASNKVLSTGRVGSSISVAVLCEALGSCVCINLGGHGHRVLLCSVSLGSHCKPSY